MAEGKLWNFIDVKYDPPNFAWSVKFDAVVATMVGRDMFDATKDPAAVAMHVADMIVDRVAEDLNELRQEIGIALLKAVKDAKIGT